MADYQFAPVPELSNPDAYDNENYKWVTFGGGYIWHAGNAIYGDAYPSKIWKIDPVTGEAISFDVPNWYGPIGYEFDSLWIVGAGDGGYVIYRIDPSTGSVTAVSMPFGPIPFAVTITSSGGYLLVHHNALGIVRVNPSTNTMVGADYLNIGDYNCVVAEGYIWGFLGDEDLIGKWDPSELRTGAHNYTEPILPVETFVLPAGIGAISYLFGDIWYSSRRTSGSHGYVGRINPTTSDNDHIELSGAIDLLYSLVSDGSTIWVKGSDGGGGIYHVDPYLFTLINDNIDPGSGSYRLVADQYGTIWTAGGYTLQLIPAENLPILPVQTAVWDLGMPAVGEKVSLNFSLTPVKVVLVDILEENDFQFTEIVPDPETGLTFQTVIDDIAGGA